MQLPIEVLRVVVRRQAGENTTEHACDCADNAGND
jgi:hypothetical protein